MNLNSSLLFFYCSVALLSFGCNGAGTESRDGAAKQSVNSVGVATAAASAPAASPSDTAAKDSTPVQFNNADPVPDIHLPDLMGKETALEDFRGKLVLLNFWATWCVPCVTEMPALERLFKTYRDRGFEVVAINVDPPEGADAVRAFVADKGLSFKVLRDAELSLGDRFGITGFPESFFVDPSGKFIAITDPETKEQGVRIVSDRPWDSTNFLTLVDDLLKRYQK